MFRKVLYLTFLIALIAGFTFTPAKAQVTGPSSYSSGFQIQNLSGTDATISIVFYDDKGAVALTKPDTVPANGSKTYATLTDLTSGFKGSVVISSNQPVASISNLTGKNASGGDLSWASYSAFSAGSTTVSLPLLFQNNFTYYTFFSVQNTGSSDANITVKYSDNTQNTASGVKPGASVTFDQKTETHSAKVFAGTVTSTQPVAVVVVEYNPTTLFSFGGFGSGSTEVVMPLINMNNFGYTTGVQIQNQGTSDTNVEVSYLPDLAGTACKEERTIKAGTSVTFALPVFTNAADPATLVSTNCVRGERFIGSARVTKNSATQNLVAVVNQLAGAANKGAAYNGFAPANGKAKVVFPLVMDRNFGYFTSWSISNVGTAEIPANGITCTVTGKDRSGSTVTKEFKNDKAMPIGGGWSLIHQNLLGDRFVGSASCTTSVAGGSLVGMVNENGGGTIDSFLVYEGFAVAP